MFAIFKNHLYLQQLDQNPALHHLCGMHCIFSMNDQKIRYIDNCNLFSLHITLLNVAPQALTLTHTFNPVSSMSAHCLEVTPNDLQYLEAFFLLLQCLLPNPLVSGGRRRKTKSSTKFYMTSGRVWPKSWLIIDDWQPFHGVWKGEWYQRAYSSFRISRSYIVMGTIHIE